MLTLVGMLRGLLAPEGLPAHKAAFEFSSALADTSNLSLRGN